MKTPRAYAILLFIGASVSARADEGYPAVVHHRGLVFEAGAGVQRAVSMSSTADDVVFMGAGYVVTPEVEIALKVYTGAEDVPQDVTRPVWGRLSLGGGGVEGTFFFNDENVWRPFVAGGFELVTLLGNGGYNGSGPHVACGMQADLSRYFSVRGAVQYARWRFYNDVGSDGGFGNFRPFVANTFGGHVSVLFYPNIVP